MQIDLFISDSCKQPQSRILSLCRKSNIVRHNTNQENNPHCRRENNTIVAHTVFFICGTPLS